MLGMYIALLSAGLMLWTYKVGNPEFGTSAYTIAIIMVSSGAALIGEWVGKNR